MAKKNNAFGGISPEIAVLGGVAVLGYVGVLNPFLKWIGIKPDDTTKQQEQQQHAAIDKTLAETEKKQKQTRTDAELSNYAEVIHQAMRFSSLDDDYEKAGLYLCMVRNDVDVLKLIKLFGIRQECYFGVICYKKNLAEMVASNLSAAKVAAINKNYASKGIKFRW